MAWIPFRDRTRENMTNEGGTITGWYPGMVGDWWDSFTADTALGQWLTNQWEGTPAAPVMPASDYASLFTNLNAGNSSALQNLLFGGEGGSGGWLQSLMAGATGQNPYVTQGAGMINQGAGMFGQGANWLGQAGAGIQGLMPQIFGAAGSYDPNASFNQFMSLAPQLQGLAMGSTGGMKEMLDAQTKEMIGSALGVSTSEFSNMGSGYSSANIDAGHRAAGSAGRDAAIGLGNTQLGIYNNLLGQAMPLTAQNQQFKTSSLLSGLGLGLEGFGAMGNVGGQFGALGSGLGNLGGTLGNLGLGQQGIFASLFGSGMNAAGGLSNPEWVAPPLNPGQAGLKDMSIQDIIAALIAASK